MTKKAQRGRPPLPDKRKRITVRIHEDLDAALRTEHLRWKLAHDSHPTEPRQVDLGDVVAAALEAYLALPEKKRKPKEASPKKTG